MITSITQMHPLFPSQAPPSPKLGFFGIIQTFVSKVLFALLAPFALLGLYDLLRGLYFAQAGQLAIGDVGLAGYILSGFLLWIALLGITDLPGGGRIATQIVWGSHVYFNLLAIPFWIFWQPMLNQSSLGFPGLSWLASLAIIPVLIISSTCLFLSLINTKPTHQHHEQPHRLALPHLPRH